MSSTEIAGLDWSVDRFLPAFQSPQQLNIYDIRHASQAVQLSATTMVGLINRPQPQVYLIVTDDDLFWLKEVFGGIPQVTSTATGDAVLDALITNYRNCIQGVIIYDPNFIDSINIATTLAGQRDGVVVSPDQAQHLQQAYDLPVLDNLGQHQWKSRVQAYDWARQNLLANSSSRLLAGLDPKNSSGLRSFLVATCTFVYWLDSRDFLPTISHELRSERGLIKQIYSSFPQGVVHLGWFIDEGSGVNLASDVGMIVLATDFFFNLETWTSLSPASSSVKEASTVQAQQVDSSKVYVSFTISDGDNLQYLQHRMKRLWSDPARGSFPLGWTISPTLMKTIPALAAYYMSTAMPNDELIAGPSGAGYMFPSSWPEDQLSAFLERTGQLMQAMKMTTIEVLDADFLQSSGLPLIATLGLTAMALTDDNLQRKYAQTLHTFGVRGILSGAGRKSADWTFSAEDVPIYQNIGLASSITQTVEMIKKAASAKDDRSHFLNIYLLAWNMTPSDLQKVIQEIGSAYEIVTPGTLLAMLPRTDL